jgi:hypothetical protein
MEVECGGKPATPRPVHRFRNPPTPKLNLIRQNLGDWLKCYKGVPNGSEITRYVQILLAAQGREERASASVVVTGRARSSTKSSLSSTVSHACTPPLFYFLLFPALVIWSSPLGTP